MTFGWPLRFVPGPFLLAACLSLGPLAASPVLAQGAGGGTAATGQNPAGQGSAGQPGQGRPATPGPGPRPGLGRDDQRSRAQLLEEERAAGAAAAPERRQEQLQDLNDIARQIAPSVPVPAPGVEGGGAAR